MEVTAGANTLPRAPVNVWRLPAVAVVAVVAGTVAAVLLLVDAELAAVEEAAV